jgi:23S rRNA (guanosine2251-2'-O)-methyltransferase
MKILLLENIRSMQNVWALFRNCDGAGFQKVLLCWCSPFPPRNEISKTALGSEQTIDWEYYRDTETCLRELKQVWYQIYSIELDERAIDYKELYKNIPENVVFVLWNEVNWVSKKTLELSDKIVMIPMLGKKESLNVSVAWGIVMYATVS